MLSYELRPHAGSGSTFIEHLGTGECRFAARVVRAYERLVVLDAGGFAFYCTDSGARTHEPGALVEGEGTLALDHFAWVENLRKSIARTFLG